MDINVKTKVSSYIAYMGSRNCQGSWSCEIPSVSAKNEIAMLHSNRNSGVKEVGDDSEQQASH